MDCDRALELTLEWPLEGLRPGAVAGPGGSLSGLRPGPEATLGASWPPSCVRI